MKFRVGLGTLWCVVVMGVLPLAAFGAEHLEYTVLTPPGYESSQRAYPVVYIVPGSGADSASAIEKLELGTYAARDEALIVVVSEIGDAKSNFIVDWFDGSKPLDTSFVRELMPEVDASYRTMPGGAHRAIAGYSAGGYSAAAITFRHPELFTSVGSFSGVTDLNWRGEGGQTAFEGINVLFYGPDQAHRRWGNPSTDQANWDEENPASQAARLTGKRGVYIASGDGQPSSPEEAAAAGPFIGSQAASESITREMNETYHQRLTEAGVPHVYRPHAGLHRSQHWREDLAIWWPMAIEAIKPAAQPARPAPAQPARLRVRLRPRRVTAGRRVSYRFRVTATEQGRRRAVSGATVRLARRTAQTDWRGRATLRVRFRARGVRHARVVKAGYLSARVKIRVRAPR